MTAATNQPTAAQGDLARLRWLAGLSILTAGEVEEVAQLARRLGLAVVIERCDLAADGRRPAARHAHGAWDPVSAATAARVAGIAGATPRGRDTAASLQPRSAGRAPLTWR